MAAAPTSMPSSLTSEKYATESDIADELGQDSQEIYSSSPPALNGHVSPMYPQYSLDQKTRPPSPLLTEFVPDKYDTPGRLTSDVYDSVLSPWRAAIRRRIVRNIEWESDVLARMQDAVRSPWLDSYFVYTSSLGTHTFFMTFLPACFWFGHEDFGRGLVVVLSLGVYFSSFVKDLICSPRPFAPPVTRLTIGSHHLEYGFPSTHSTNGVSMALLFYSNLSASSPLYPLYCALLVFYTFSIVYGRLYTGMHSFTDCFVGVVLGAGLWFAWIPAGVGRAVEAWIASAGWEVPAILAPLCLLMVHKHPQPVDDCPCFEDAIAFVSVVLGVMLSFWHRVHYGYDAAILASVMPGSAWATWGDIALWSGAAAAKLVVGLLVIFTWRILAKSTLHLVLPPIFRMLAHAFTLPHRRFYTPATDYTRVPAELGLHPIPSVIDLPGQISMELDTGLGDDEVEVASGRGTPRGGGKAGELKLRNTGIYGLSGGAFANGNGSASSTREDSKGYRVHKSVAWEPEAKGFDAVKHYDADVLTKVIVYCGIAMLSSQWLPVMFEVLGWGVH